MRLADYGDRAVLIDTDQPLQLRDALLAQHDPAIALVVPAARTVLLEFCGTRPDVTELLDRLQLADAPRADQPALQLPVRYDGPDLAQVAEQTGLSAADVVRTHSEVDYVVQFCGFSPGFGYLTGLDERLRLPRLPTPRAAVPAGSVAIADEYTGVYPQASPGGWRLLGHTDATLFDLTRTPPALLTPGRRVRFVPS